MRRKVRNEADAVECLAAMRRAGCATVVWAREHGVDARSLNAWKVALERRVSKRRRLKAAPLQLVELVSAVRPQARYAFDVGGVRVEVDDTFEAETLQRLVRTLRAC